jgi:hypothetical protein
MRQHVFILVAAVLCVGRIGMGTEYLVRVETVGYVNVPDSEQNPKEDLLRSFEAVCRPSTPVQCTAVVGKETIRLKLLLRPAKENDRFSVDIDYECSVDTGSTIPDKHGGRMKAPEVESAATNITARLNEPVGLGGLICSKTDRVGKQQVTSKSKEMTRLSVTEFRPPPKKTE